MIVARWSFSAGHVGHQTWLQSCGPSSVLFATLKQHFGKWPIPQQLRNGVCCLWICTNATVLFLLRWNVYKHVPIWDKYISTFEGYVKNRILQWNKWTCFTNLQFNFYDLLSLLKIFRTLLVHPSVFVLLGCRIKFTILSSLHRSVRIF
jgi:hypothetical protein